MELRTPPTRVQLVIDPVDIHGKLPLCIWARLQLKFTVYFSYRFCHFSPTPLAELRKETRSNSAEYTRNQAAVSNFRGKYEELKQLKEQVKAMRTEIDDLKAELEEARANPTPGRKVPLFDVRRDTTKRGAPYPPYFENVIAPAMLNTGATPEQINEIIRKETISCVTLHFNCFMPVPTFNRALRAAIFRAVRVPHESPLYFVVA